MGSLSSIIAAARSEGVSLAGVFDFVSGLGLLMCVWIGAVRVLNGSREGSTFVDPADVAPHWRGYLKTGVVLIVIGLLGRVVVAV